MIIRQYRQSDCKEITELFYDTIHAVNINDYTDKQINAWADGKPDLEKWNKSLSENYTLVAVDNGLIVGFGDINNSGYLDRLYVHKDYQRKGIASAICNRLEKKFNVPEITVHASVTAKIFFEKRNYKTIKMQQVERHGIHISNYIMKLNLQNQSFQCFSN